MDKKIRNTENAFWIKKLWNSKMCSRYPNSEYFQIKDSESNFYLHSPFI